MDAAKKRKKKHRKAAPLIRKAHVVATKAGPVKLTIKPSSAGRKVLRKRGKFTVKVQIKFTPAGGTPRTSVKKVTLKLKPRKHRKHHR